ncbi:MAG: class I SAM-dependent methyltransferase [Nitrospirae bacterium]|nr:class I SAM-dependent methyltransferase [Nitrospirota bacterium]
MVEKEQWRLEACKNCQLIVLNPRPTPEYFQRLYDPVQQYDYQVNGERYITLADQFIGAYLSLIKGFERYVSPGKLLEIGSAVGFFLEAARRRGWQPQGVELSRGGADYCREHFGIDVFCGKLVDAPFEANSFDCVVAIHTLEHIDEPVVFLKRAIQVLRPGGLMFIEIPYLREDDVLNGLASRDGLELPNHLTHFTAASLTMVLTGLGIEILRSEASENLQVWARKRVTEGPTVGASRPGFFQRMFSSRSR